MPRLTRRALPVDTVELARFLIGQTLVHATRRRRLAGRIVETEAYPPGDPTGYARPGLTTSNAPLFEARGTAYVRMVYGACLTLNLAAEPEGVGAAVLIRALEPLEGIEEMRERRGLQRLEDLCSGPGKLTQALGIELDLNGSDLQAGPITIEPAPPGYEDVEPVVATRIGITKAAELPWRFCVPGSRSVSRPWPKLAA